MPETDKNIKKKHWYEKLWGKITAFVAICGAVWGILEGVYYFTQEWHDIQTMKSEWEEMKEGEKWVNKNINKLLRYVEDKKNSFHVGFRKVKIKDAETGKEKWVKRYRDWDGEWHDIFYDHEASSLYGVDYYYYIDESKAPPNNQVYCW